MSIHDALAPTSGSEGVVISDVLQGRFSRESAVDLCYPHPMSEDLLQNPPPKVLETARPDALFERHDVFDDDALAQLSPQELIGVISDLRLVMMQQEARFASIAEIGTALGSTFNLDELLTIVMSKITELMGAERSTLFLLDETHGELWSKVTQGVVNTEIRLRVGEGVAGWVAATGKSMNIEDAYSDPRFNSDVDIRTGYQTRSILCQPIRNQAGRIIGVVQVLNRVDGPFTAEDENLLSALASQVAIAIENSKLYLSVVEKNMELTELTEQLERKIAELDLLYEIEKVFSQRISLEALVESVTQKTNELFQTEGSALVIRETDHLRFYVESRRSSGWEFFVRDFPNDTGVCGRVIDGGDPYLCNTGDCSGVPGAATEVLGMIVQNVICAPLYDNEERVIGALKVVNRQKDFTRSDLKLLSVIGSRIAGAVVARRQHEEMEKSRRLASIGQMLSGVVHDLKNPFAVINGYVQLMARSDDRAKRDAWAGTIKKQFAHLNQMTGELLNFASGERNFWPREVNMDEMLDDIVQGLGHELEGRNIELVTNLEYTGPAHIDDGKAKRAILNLARNAADAMPDGGTFTINVSLDEDDDTLLFTFTDTGKGIPEAIRDTLFDEFVTRGKTHGTGLGLAIVKAIVEQHHGTIWFESTLNEGTTFFVKLPRVAR